MRRQWITTINAGVREHGLQYSAFIHGLKRLSIDLDRKILAELVLNEVPLVLLLVVAWGEGWCLWCLRSLRFGVVSWQVGI